mmetsp:Transcript_11296/g.27779  ORF Transcript_11296/g.27779 Transcript_11296/m.27779 type:complete len:298 (+) Transcript_11296:458-1351(+)
MSLCIKTMFSTSTIASTSASSSKSSAMATSSSAFIKKKSMRAYTVAAIGMRLRRSAYRPIASSSLAGMTKEPSPDTSLHEACPFIDCGVQAPLYRSRKDPERKALPERGAPPGMVGMSGMTSSMLSGGLIVSGRGATDWLGRMLLALARVKEESESRMEDGSEAAADVACACWCSAWACCAMSEGSSPSESCVDVDALPMWATPAIFLTLQSLIDWICRIDNLGTRADTVGRTSSSIDVAAWQWRGVMMMAVFSLFLAVFRFHALENIIKRVLAATIFTPTLFPLFLLLLVVLVVSG